MKDLPLLSFASENCWLWVTGVLAVRANADNVHESMRNTNTVQAKLEK